MIPLNHHVQQLEVPSPTTATDARIAVAQIISTWRSSFVFVMEPVKLLTSGLTLEESKAKRQEKQAARYRHRLGCVPTPWVFSFFAFILRSFTLLRHSFRTSRTYVPSGDSRGLLEALIATSPRKTLAPRRLMIPESKKQGKPTKYSTKGDGNDQVVDDSTGEQTKLRKPTSRRSIKAADHSEKEANPGADHTTTCW